MPIPLPGIIFSMHFLSTMSYELAQMRHTLSPSVCYPFPRLSVSPLHRFSVSVFSHPHTFYSFRPFSVSPVHPFSVSNGLHFPVSPIPRFLQFELRLPVSSILRFIFSSPVSPVHPFSVSNGLHFPDSPILRFPDYPVSKSLRFIFLKPPGIPH